MKIKYKLILKLLVVLLPLFLLFLAGYLIKIHEIDCISQYTECDMKLSEKIKNVEGKSYIESKRMLNEILNEDYLVKEYQIQFNIPNKLYVFVIEKKAIYALAKNSKDSFSLIDKEGFVIKSSDNTSLPTLITNNNLPSPGERIDSKDLFSLELVLGVQKISLFKTAWIENNSLLIELPDGLKIIFPQEGNRELLLGSFNLILNKLNTSEDNSKIEKGKIKEIDFRFKNPVLKFS